MFVVFLKSLQTSSDYFVNIAQVQDRLGGVLVERPPWCGGRGFYSRPGHTKDMVVLAAPIDAQDCEVSITTDSLVSG